MAKLKLKSGAIEVERNITGRNLLHVLQELIPDGFSADDAICHVGAREVDLSQYCINREIDEDVCLLITPKGIETLAIIAISLVVSLAVSHLLTPDMPSSTTSQGTKQSPNNSFHGQRNEIRLDEQEPNIYGQNISYPDSIVREGGAWEYVNNRKIIKQAFLVGSGAYQINSEPKFELTPISSIPGSSSSVYQPGEIVPVVQGQFNSEIVDGQTLLGPNNSEASTGLTASSNSIFSYTISTTEADIDVDNTEQQWIDIADKFNQDGPMHVNLTYEVGILNDEDPAVCIRTQITAGCILTEVDESLGHVYGLKFEGAQFNPGNCSISVPKLVSVTEIIGTSLDVDLPVVDNEIQVSFDFRGGLRGSVSVYVVITEKALMPYSTTHFKRYASDTANQLFFTEKFAVSGNNEIKVTLIRVNNDKTDNTDRVQVSQVASNSYRFNVNYGDRTILTTERKATEQALKTTQSKINIDVTRKTISYNSATQSIDYNLTASRSFADAILHEYVIMAGQNPDDLPLDKMYEVANRIGELGNFDGTLDNKEESLKSKLSKIANTTRSFITHTVQNYEFYRDEPRHPAGQIDSRNISKKSTEDLSYKGATLNSNDGVKVQWINPDGNKVDYIYHTIASGVSTRCEHQGGGIYIPPLPAIPYELDLAGCRTESQAIDRSDLECRKLIHIQKAINSKVLSDGENWNRGQVLKHADYYEEDIASGELKSINSGMYESFSELNIPTGSYHVTYTNRYGEMKGPISCQVVSSTMFMSDLPGAYVADGLNEQSGSRFIISTLEEHDMNLYYISDKITNNDGTVSLDLVQYSEEIYSEI